VRKKKDKVDDSEDETLRKLKAGSALSSTKAQPQIDLSAYVTFKQFEEERSKMAKDLDEMKTLAEKLHVQVTQKNDSQATEFEMMKKTVYGVEGDV
jgi:SMC interacting uncharacterized protein involved in chromosome segregation